MNEKDATMFIVHRLGFMVLKWYDNLTLTVERNPLSKQSPNIPNRPS